MDRKNCKRGEIIFRQGEAGDCLYDIERGSVGVFANYGTVDEKLLATLKQGDFFGEMSLLEKAPRSATAVAMEDDTCLDSVTEDSFFEFFEKNPERVFAITKQLSQRLRRTTQEYLALCGEVYESVEAEKRGEVFALSMDERKWQMMDRYANFDVSLYI